jgi:hypothetical protein
MVGFKKAVFSNGEGGTHTHALDRESKRTSRDGKHRHVFDIPNHGLIFSDDDGPHWHSLELETSDESGASSSKHKHRVVLPNGVALETDEGGEHVHELMVATSACDGLHTHELVLENETVIESLTPGEFWVSSRETMPEPSAQGPEPGDEEELEFSKGVVPYKTGAVTDAPWDGPAARRDADVETLKLMAVWVDDKNPDIKSSYKLIHHLPDGELTISRAGVIAAMASLNGARDGVQIPSSDRQAAWGHLARHYRDDLELEPPELLEGRDEDELEVEGAEEGRPDQEESGAISTVRTLKRMLSTVFTGLS